MSRVPVELRRTGGIPIGIEHDETIGTDEIETAATGFAAEHEDEIRALEGNEGEIGTMDSCESYFGIVEAVDNFAAFLDRHRTVETNELIPRRAHGV